MFLNELITGIIFFLLGACTVFFISRLKTSSKLMEIEVLRAEIIQTLEEILRYSRQHNLHYGVNYQLSDTIQNAWHNKFLVEKFFLMSGFYEVGPNGEVRIRSALQRENIEHFLKEVRNGEFNNLVSLMDELPGENFYVHRFYQEEEQDEAIADQD